MRVSIEHEGKVTELQPRAGEAATDFGKRVSMIIGLQLGMGPARATSKPEARAVNVIRQAIKGRRR